MRPRLKWAGKSKPLEFSGVPRATTGRVISAEPSGRVKPALREARDVFNVAIQWDLPQERPLTELVIPGDDPTDVALY